MPLSRQRVSVFGLTPMAAAIAFVPTHLSDIVVFSISILLLRPEPNFEPGKIVLQLRRREWLPLRSLVPDVLVRELSYLAWTANKSPLLLRLVM